MVTKATRLTPDATGNGKAVTRSLNFWRRSFIWDGIPGKTGTDCPELTGAGFSPDKFAAEKAADVLSACVNHMFNDLLNEGEPNGIYRPEEHPMIVPARSPKALEIYTVYQLVKGRFDKLHTGESDREKYASVAEKLNEYGIWKPRLKRLSDGKEWAREDVAWMLQPENINAQINIQNQKYARLSAEDETETESGNASTAKNI